MHMTDVVDSDELLRRIQRARAFAAREEREWRARGEEAARTDPRAAGEAKTRRVAYEVVLEVLDEIVRPGKHPVQG
ncbi:hypothetical protein GCM10009601_55120 [Streptomyces thermospinosisporus]|uniref:Uncharacterized protein n=2 Tax=Streptomyces thermospinosisporus TaxID=161482 RepID=A0ABP4JWG0_9ACTN